MFSPNRALASSYFLTSLKAISSGQGQFISRGERKTTREKLGLNQGPHALQVTTGPWPLENDNWAIASRVDKCRKLLEEKGCCNNNANN